MCFKFNFGKRISLKLIWSFWIFTCKDRRILVLTQRNNSRKFMFWKHLNVSLALSLIFHITKNSEWINLLLKIICIFVQHMKASVPWLCWVQYRVSFYFIVVYLYAFWKKYFWRCLFEMSINIIEKKRYGSCAFKSHLSCL